MPNLYIAEKASMGHLIASALSNDYNAPLISVEKFSDLV